MSDIVSKGFLDVTIAKAGEDGPDVTALVAKTGEVDREGDMAADGSFPDGANVLVSDYNHSAVPMLGPTRRPVGKGVLNVEGRDVVAKVNYFPDDNSQASLETVRNTGGLQEWSFVASIRDEKIEEVDGRAVRVFLNLDPYEVSPVLKGGGNSTRTLAMKSLSTVQDEVLQREVMKALVEMKARGVEPDEDLFKALDDLAAPVRERQRIEGEGLAYLASFGFGA
jgi:hypothetical protein